MTDGPDEPTDGTDTEVAAAADQTLAPTEAKTEEIDLQVEIQRSYLDYAMSVIVGRALPDVRDGLKPVHRRVLYAMYDGGYRPDRGWNKCSRVVGEVMGLYHPHGDSAIYDTLVRLAQPWVMRAPLVSGQGNFGSPGNDPAAAMRYTECKMAPLSMEMVRDITENTVDFKPNYDNRETEPVVLPARFPNLLVNGSTGIAVGMATNIPTHNLREVAVGRPVVARRTRRRSKEELLEAAMERVKGPDFPNGALIVGRKGIEDAYRTGRGSVIMRAVIDIEEDKAGRTQLVVTELPHMCNPDNLAVKIAELVNAGKMSGIADIRDDSSARTGQRLVILLKRDAQPRVVMNNLYKHTQLQDTFGCNMLALVDDVPRTLRLDQFITYWVRHQIQVIQRRTAYRLDEAEKRAHLDRGLVKALDRLDEVLALIRASRDAETAREGLKDLLEIDDLQALHILNTQLRRLAAMEIQQIIDRLAEIELQITEFKDILSKVERQRQIVSDELAEIVDKYGDERRTRIIAADGDMSDEDFIPDDDMVVTITRGGYAKRTRTDLYRTQKRGGKGVRGASLRVDDEVDHLFATTSHHWILFFTNLGPGVPGEGVAAAGGRTGRQGRPRGRPAELPAGRADRGGADAADLRRRAVPAAGDAQRPGEEDRAAGLRLAAPGRRDRDQLPRGRRRADRCGAVQPRRRRPAGVPQGPGDPVRGRRRPAASDGTGDVRRHRHEVPERRRAAEHVDHRCGHARGRPVRVHGDRRRLREADGRQPVPPAGTWRARHQGHEAERGPRVAGGWPGGAGVRRGDRDQGERPDHALCGGRGAGEGTRHDGREVRRGDR